MNVSPKKISFVAKITVFSAALAFYLVNVESAGAITNTFVDTDSSNFDAAISNSISTTLDFDSESDGLFSSNSRDFAGTDGQSLNISAININDIGISGTSFGLDPLGGSGKQVAVDTTNNGEAIVTFSFAQPINYFGIHVGDLHDITSLNPSSFDLDAGGTKIVDNITESVESSSTGDVTYFDSAAPGGEQLTVGNNIYTFFGIVDNTNPFSTVTLTLDSNGSQDNFGFDSISYGPVAVPFEPSPYLGLLIIGGIWGLNKFKKSRRIIKLSSDYRQI